MGASHKKRTLPHLRQGPLLHAVNRRSIDSMHKGRVGMGV